jgi:acetyl-CoA acyltransferase
VVHPCGVSTSDSHANDLLGTVRPASIERAGIDPSVVEDVIAGCVQQYGDQSSNVGRNAWLQAGLPFETPATTVDRQCGSAQQAVNFATALIASEHNTAVMGCGVEHMGKIPMFYGQKWEDEVGTPWPATLRKHHDVVPQGVSAELIANKWSIDRQHMDEIAVRSHHNAARAQAEGRFDREIVSVTTPDGSVDTDQGIRPTSSME